jgi:hypothetical protein
MTRHLDTIPSPDFEDDFPVHNEEERTSPHHFIPSNSGLPPEEIEGAPPWANRLFAEMRSWQKSNRESVHDLRDRVQIIATNTELLAHEFERFSTEYQQRSHSQEGQLIKLRKALGEVADRVAELERRAAKLELHASRGG